MNGSVAGFVGFLACVLLMFMIPTHLIQLFFVKAGPRLAIAGAGAQYTFLEL